MGTLTPITLFSSTIHIKKDFKQPNGNGYYETPCIYMHFFSSNFQDTGLEKVISEVYRMT